MYAEFYGLRELPFNITPDPRFLYLNDCYREAVAALTYGIESRKGFLSLIGEAGTGKTTLLRHVLDTLGPSTRTVLLLTPTVSFEEILEHILVELGIPTDGGGKLVRLQRLSEFLIEHTRAGGNVALLVDEAQDMSPAVLEELRLLSNLETAREKILQIILAGQPELEATLGNPSLRQLRQRVALRIRLRPLATGEVRQYVRSRLERAGAARLDVFTAAALGRVAGLTEGVPRLVNVLCDAALLAAFASGRRRVTVAAVDEAWRDYESDGAAATHARVEPLPAAEDEEAEPPPDESQTAPCGEEAASGAGEDGEAVQPADVEPEPEDDGLPRDAARAALARAAPRAPRSTTLSVPVAAGVVAVMALALAATSWQQYPREVASLRGPVVTSVATLPTAAAEPAAPSPAPPVRPREGAQPRLPLSVDEATALIDDFRAAYEALDAERLARLFAADAMENGRQGHGAIAAAYRSALQGLDEVRYGIERLSVEPRGGGTDVRGPFLLRYTRAGAEPRELRGQAEWRLERRAGRPVIAALHYRLEPAEPGR